MKNHLQFSLLGLLGGALLIAGCNGAPTGAPPASTNTASTSPVSTKNEANSAMAMKPRTNTTKLAFSSSPSAIPVGKPATWTLQISDAKSGAPVDDFEVEMTKKMHLIVVKNDLSWFNHIHPTLQDKGKFVVTTTLPSAGSYKIYADYTRKSAGQEVAQFEFATADATVKSAKNEALLPDKMQNMWLVNKFNAHPDGQPDIRGGKSYEVALMPMPTPITAQQETMLHFQIRDDKGVPVKDLQPYLGAKGHCVVLSSDTNSYLHSHPISEGMDHSMGEMKMDSAAQSAGKQFGPDVMFHTTFPKAGIYKVWGQFQHQGKIITAAFVVKVEAENPKNNAAQTEGAADENHSHVH